MKQDDDIPAEAQDDPAGGEGAAQQDPKVGYRNPPKSGQFRAGNPGRPAGSRNRPKSLAEEIEAALETEIALGGGDDIVSARKAIAKKLVRDALMQEAKITQGFAKIALENELIERRWKKQYPNGDDSLSEILSAAMKKNGLSF